MTCKVFANSYGKVWVQRHTQSDHPLTPTPTDVHSHTCSPPKHPAAAYINSSCVQTNVLRRQGFFRRITPTCAGQTVHKLVASQIHLSTFTFSFSLYLKHVSERIPATKLINLRDGSEKSCMNSEKMAAGRQG